MTISTYQTSLAERGAFLEYDMIGMDYYYADQDAQSPSDEENARAIRALVDMGLATACCCRRTSSSRSC